MSTPGIADPYFYEWYVGIKCLEPVHIKVLQFL